MTHHQFLLMLARFGKAGLLAFALANPVTWAFGMGFVYVLTGKDISEYVLGAQSTTRVPLPKPRPAYCDILVEGKKYRVWTDCSQVQFPGKKVSA